MKQLTITLTLPITPDEFGLHTIPDGTREWLGLLRTGAEEHGCTVAMEVEDIKGLRKATGRPRGPRKNAASTSPTVEPFKPVTGIMGLPDVTTGRLLTSG